MKTASLYSRLENWALWCKSPGRPQGHCRSIEYRYKAEGAWDVKYTPPAIDHFDAIDIEAAITSPEFCPILRGLLVAEFIYRANPFATAKRLRFHPRDYQAKRTLALMELAERL